MGKEKKELKYSSLGLKFNNLRPIENTGFVRGECLVAYGGKNRNYTNIPREAFDKAEASVIGIPIVGNWIEDSTEENGGRFGGHDVVLEQKGNDVVMRDTTVPFGFVPQDANPRWTDVEDENGNSKSYFTVDVILWEERYPRQVQAVADGKTGQSMEIFLNDADWDDNYEYLDIKDFYYSALCLLGKDENNSSKNVEPCFENSTVTIKEFSSNENFKYQLTELKTAFQGGEEVEKEKDFVETEEEVETEPVVEEEVETETEEEIEETPEAEATEEEVVEEENKKEEEEESDEDEKEEEEFSYKEEFLALSEKYATLEKEAEELREFKAKIEAEEEAKRRGELIDSYSLLLTKEEIEDCVEDSMTSDDIDIALSKAYAKKSLNEAKKANFKKDPIKLPNREEGSGESVKKNRFAL